jgi:hypothetical protein
LDVANVYKTHPVPREMETVMCKVKNKLRDLINPLFMDLVLNVEMSQREFKANAKLEASLKKKKTLDLAQVLEEDQAAQNVVAPENMKDLVNSLVDKRIDHQGRQKTKALLKTALTAARKKYSGGARTANTPPSKQGHGGTQRGLLKRVSFGNDAPPPKRAKKLNTRSPDTDYRALERQRQTPNPYANRPNNNNSPTRPPFHSGRGYSPGRGRGRGQTRGGSSNGRGRGRGRY